MKLSDAITAGAALIKSAGPEYPNYDILVAAQAGLLGRLPTQQETLEFYWSNPWGATHFTPLEYWMRMATLSGMRWADVINKLKSHGA